jgi:hypothetical protein
MTNKIKFSRVLTDSDVATTGVSPLNGEVTFATPFRIAMQTNPKMQVCSIQVSDLIPNIFDANPYYAFNNTLLRVWTNDTSGNPITVKLPRGLYSTVEQIALAINTAINSSINPSWYTDPEQPALSIVGDPITQQVIIAIDTTLLRLPHTTMTVDLRKTSTGTDLAQTLGFSTNASLMYAPAGTTTYFVSDKIVQMATQGTAIDVQCDLVAPSRVDNRMERTLATIVFAGKNTSSDNVWPSAGQLSSLLLYDGPKEISRVSFKLLTRSGKPMLFSSGGVYIDIEFRY